MIAALLSFFQPLLAVVNKWLDEGVEERTVRVMDQVDIDQSSTFSKKRCLHCYES